MDAIELLTRDHRAVEKLFSEFAKGDDAARRRSAEAIIRELSIHAAIEEETFYPAVRREMPACDALVEHGIDEHQEVKEILSALDGMVDKAHTKAFADRMQRLERSVTEHVDEEEGKLFPSVREGFTKTALDDLGTAMNKAKKAAPTRPHPGAPSSGPAQAVIGKAAGAVDRVRDAVSGRPRN